MPQPGDQHQDNAATVNPFVVPKQNITQFTAREIATLQSRLDKQLGPEFISTRAGPGGGRVHYLAAEKAINLANEVFGFNGWSSSIQNVQVDFVDENPRSGEISLGLSTIVRVTLRDGTFHEDVGYGQIKNCKGKAAAFEKAKKEAATDAMKRALRNFGNVLGNCLYDKDYLQRVSKVKVTPSKWDVENLHRHRDFAPIKKESIADVEAQMEQEAASRRQISAQTNASFGSVEFEDDFGGNLFDEADFVNPDEVKLDGTPAPRPAAGISRNGPPQQHPNKTHTMPPQREPNLPPPTGISAPQHPPSISGPPRPPNNAVRSSAQRPQQHPPSHNAPRGNGIAQTIPQPQHPLPKPNSSSAGTNESSETARDEGSDFPEPCDPPAGIPEGFVPGNAAILLQQISTTRPAKGMIPNFDPRADSPSIRRTSGINPGRSAAVTRQSLNGSSGGPMANASAPTANPSIPAHASGGNGTTTPVRSNYINPAADPNRRVGMPPPAGNPHAGPNRSAYKPPSAAKRPALSDMSNLQKADRGGEMKKAKLDSGGDGGGGDGDGGGEGDASVAVT